MLWGAACWADLKPQTQALRSAAEWSQLRVGGEQALPTPGLLSGSCHRDLAPCSMKETEEKTPGRGQWQPRLDPYTSRFPSCRPWGLLGAGASRATRSPPFRGARGAQGPSAVESQWVQCPAGGCRRAGDSRHHQHSGTTRGVCKRSPKLSAHTAGRPPGESWGRTCHTRCRWNDLLHGHAHLCH